MSNAKSTASMPMFWLLWSGQAISLLGTQLVQFALIWWLTKTTESGTVLATASLVGLLPQVVLGPVIGALVDRWNRQRILLVADSSVALMTLFLAYLFWLDVAQPWHVFVILFLRAVGNGFHSPTMTGTTALMVPAEHLARVQGLNQTLQAGMGILSAPLGAILLDALGMTGALLIDAGTAVFAILPLFLVIIPQPTPAAVAKDSPQKPSLWREIVAGITYVRARRGVIGLIGMATIINFLLMPAASLMPLLVTNHFHGGAIQYAFLESTIGAGALIGGITLSVWGGFKQRIYTTLLGIGGIGVGVLITGLAPSSLFGMAIVGMGIVGVTMVWTNGSLMVILQTVVEPGYQGRVFTLVNTLAGGMAPIGLILAGPVADRFGVQMWLVVGGLACLVLVGVGLASATIRNVEETSPQPTYA